VVQRSNEIFVRLARTARTFPHLCEAMGALPRMLRVRVGERQIGVLHGDPESLSGWSRAAEALAGLDDPGAAPADVSQTPRGRIADWFRRAEVD
jgi:hypothetical protein